MDIWLLVQALIQGLVEGLTEFLPVSSTGHLIVSGALIGFDDDRAKVFNIVIQSGAILAICVEYRKRIASVVGGLFGEASARQFALNLVLAFLPSAVIGLLFGKIIKNALFNPTTVAIAFIAGGLIILLVERRQRVVIRDDLEALTGFDALKIGCAQCLAFIPGTSRSGATIIGGLVFGLSRKVATEFSFFLAIPTIFAATALELWKDHEGVSVSDIPMFMIGFLMAFFSAWLAIKALLRFVSSHSFVGFAWYRIAFGVLILSLVATGIVH